MLNSLTDFLKGKNISAVLAFLLIVGAFYVGVKITSFEYRLANAEKQFEQVDKQKEAINILNSNVGLLAERVHYRFPQPLKYVERKVAADQPQLAAASISGSSSRELAAAIRAPQCETWQRIKKGLLMRTDTDGRILITAPLGRALKYSQNLDGTLVIDYQ